MSITIQEDLVAGSRLEDSPNGAVLTRFLLVSGLDPTPQNTLMYRALFAEAGTPNILEAVPDIGDSHEAEELNMFVVEHKTVASWMNDRTTAVIALTYRDMSAVRITRNTLLTNSTTRFDQAGNRLQTSYNGTLGPVEAPIMLPNTV
ncbi:MAG: hypothetical protein PHI18_10505, partial [bacterium]|nr:hypothetical protein [bacterium]